MTRTLILHAPRREYPVMPIHRRAPALVAVAAICGAAALAIPAAGNAASTPTVTLKNISFTPKTVKIKKGGSVKWVWKDGSVPHNVTFKSQHSKTQTKGTYTVKFKNKGTFSYRCTIHPGMVAKVVVS
jgi:plastocyanin